MPVIKRRNTNEDCAKTIASTENNLAKDANTSFIEEKSVKDRSPPKQREKHVLYAKIKENESFERLCGLAKCVRKHFANFEISSTDQREFNPHLTIAKIDFSKKKHKVLKKIEPSLFETFVNEYVGCETVVGIQLLSMTSPKNEAGYYIGENLFFESNISGSSREASLADINEKKKDIRTKIAHLAGKIFK
ncbi:hypothetical protein AVEN_115227-1 [Araneus ventricosus]|uniref:A-kinase anchor protein 7-like phosphoesterase domain-containing protein n=1 Tax=Araneus ventricosus TaxID=182803 RepID=A0A4Y1ZXR1_ARAVE|nr:hypothetical protein AVEN_115227-1 [Araneus ventricosus]